jgi:hypothetical protein
MSEIDLLKSKLEGLEKGLRQLLESTENDLAIARELQKALMPNRVPDIAGLTVFGRFISAGELSAEAFDLLPTKDGRQLWFTASWASSFGLGSLLLQTLVHLQSRALVESKPRLTPAEAFNDLSTALTQARRAGQYRLMVARLDMASLQVEGTAIGMPPLLRRTREKNLYSAFETVQDEALRRAPDLLKPTSSAAPVLAADAYTFSFTLPPGSRLFYLSPSWRDPSTVGEYTQPLQLGAASPDSQLIDDLNSLLIAGERHMQMLGRRTDLTALAFEVDARRLHLA